MKKLISILLCFAILSGAFCAFPVSASEDTHYSGGSGTEDDPYLISTPDDIREINQNIENDPSLWSRKVYYKLTNDIKVPCSISPLYFTDHIGPNCYVKTEYDLYYDFSYRWDKELQKYVEPEGDGITFSDAVNKIGPLTAMFYYTEYPWHEFSLQTTVLCIKSNYKTFESYIEDRDIGALADSGGYYDGYKLSYDSMFYRSAAFTGVFDGNGYTLSTSGGSDTAGFLFGFVKNGAEIKNLKVQSYVGGNNGVGSLAYSIDSSCTVRNCSFNYKSGKSITYLSDEQLRYDYDSEYGTYDNYIEKIYETVSGFVVKDHGNYVDCINYGLAEIKGSKLNYVDIGGSLTDATQEDCYTLEECTAAGGDSSAFEHLDFENTWTMIDGMPALKVFCDRGDLNFDGVLNGKDANAIKQIIATGGKNLCEAGLILSDVNSDGTVNAKDANVLKKKIAG